MYIGSVYVPAQSLVTGPASSTLTHGETVAAVALSSLAIKQVTKMRLNRYQFGSNIDITHRLWHIHVHFTRVRVCRMGGASSALLRMRFNFVRCDATVGYGISPKSSRMLAVCALSSRVGQQQGLSKCWSFQRQKLHISLTAAMARGKKRQVC